MIPFRWVTGGGDQVKFTSLSLATPKNISGYPVGAKRPSKINSRIFFQLGDLVKDKKL